MSIKAEVIADSVSHSGERITSIQITCHRFILAELNTHRKFSRNYRSSRAVPVKKLIEEVRVNPAMPVHWGSNKPGMQASKELEGLDLEVVENRWRQSAAYAAGAAEQMMSRGLHKQVANRVLEPFLYVHGLVTSTDWENFYTLRRHADAQPEIHVLADAMWAAQQASKPTLLGLGWWHLPYTNTEDRAAVVKEFGDQEEGTEQILALVSAARCARVSYKMFDGSSSNLYDDLELANKLKWSGHWSPFEHQATPDQQDGHYFPTHQHQHRNFTGWRQHRAIIGG